MADAKISALPAASTPLAGTEVLPIVQSGTTDKVSVANLTAGRAVSMLSAAAGNVTVAGNTISTTNTNGVLNIQPNGTGYVDTRGTYGDPATSGTTPNAVAVFSTNDTFNALYIGQKTASPYNMWVQASARNDLSAVKVIDLNPRGGNVTFGANLVQNTAAGGINFTANTPAAGMTSQLLNWYEEGTWTPTLTYSGGNGDLSYSQQIGFYTRIGNCVTFEVRLLFGETTASGYIASINGLPFTSKSGGYAGGGMYIDNMTGLTGGGQWIIGSAATTINPIMSGTGGASVINASSTGAANNVITISGVYYV